MESDLCLKKNTGNVDRVIRGIAAGLLIGWAAVSGWPRWAVALVAAFGGGLAVEAITGY